MESLLLPLEAFISDCSATVQQIELLYTENKQTNQRSTIYLAHILANQKKQTVWS